MRERVLRLYNSRAVSKIALGCKVVTGLVGIAAIATAIYLMIQLGQSFGWTSESIPIYGCLGLMAFTGTLLSVYSFRWLKETYQKQKEFNAAQSVLKHP